MEIERISLEPLVRLPHLTWDKFYYNFVEDCKERDRIVSIHDVLFGLLRLEAEITAARMASLLSVTESLGDMLFVHTG